MASEQATPPGPGIDLEAAAKQGMFSADTGALAEYINTWRNEADSMMEDGIQLRMNGGGVFSPAADPITNEYFDVLSQTFVELAEHNGRMSQYTGAYVHGLTASAQAMDDLEARQVAKHSDR